MNTLLEHTWIVLCRPEGGGNVGSVCRGMKNMGLSKLAIIDPSPDMDQLQLKKMGLHSMEIYDNAIFPDSLEEFLAPMVLSAGITRRRGSRRKFFSYLPEEFAQKATEVVPGEVALVFGNEQHGLNDRELAACSTAVHIPTSPEHPSLNLSHAVQVMAYTFFRHSEEMSGAYVPISDQEVQELTDMVRECLDELGLFRKRGVFSVWHYFHDIFSRAAMTREEADHMNKIFKAIQHRKSRQ